MTEWLKECEICNAGLCKEMTYLTDSVERGGVGLSVREAAKRLEDHATKQIGEKVWTAEQIRARYLYHTGQMTPGRNSTTPEKATTPEKVTPQVLEPQPQQVPSADTHAIDFATMAISQLGRINKDDPRREEAFDEVQAWINKNRKPSRIPDPASRLYETDKVAFYSLLRHVNRELGSAMGLTDEEMVTGWDTARYAVYPASDEEKEIRQPSISLTKEQFEKAMEKHPKPLETKVIKALIDLDRLVADAHIHYAVPVPDEVYSKMRKMQDKKSQKSRGAE